MRSLYLFLALIIAASTLNAQPQGYYDGTEGLTGNALKTALHNIIKNDDHVSYNGMWSAYQVTDKRPGTNYVWDIYSDVPGGVPPYNFTFVTDQCGSYNGEGDCYNREHLWAQSWTNNDGTHKTDLHHVYPTDGFVNGKRNNYAFGEVRNASWTSRNGGKLGANTVSGFSGTVFEPIDEYKGDIARALMYVSVRYFREDSQWDNSDMTTKSVIKDWAMTMLLRWHEEDPVSDKEINRNNAVYGKQGNRNPFVDYPDFAPMIWDPHWDGIEDQYVSTVLVNVWPNPATSTVNVKGENLNAVYMYNAMGQLILTIDMQNIDSQTVIDVSGFNSGIYFMNVISENGNSTLKKVVVQ
ncbi:MAG: endonuclease [Bacteroidales bacterium]|nr:endonuclease [Bacteroidales bacterium]